MACTISGPDYLCCNIEGFIVVKHYITTNDEKETFFKDPAASAGRYGHPAGLFCPAG